MLFTGILAAVLLAFIIWFIAVLREEKKAALVRKLVLAQITNSNTFKK